ncbi:hypothetical protein D3C76_1301690 [compost metagenome]
MLRTELDVLLPTRIVQPELVVGRSPQHIAFVVTQRHVVGMFTVVQGMGDVGPVWITLLERHRHFSTADQRQMQAMGVTGVGACQT